LIDKDNKGVIEEETKKEDIPGNDGPVQLHTHRIRSSGWRWVAAEYCTHHTPPTRAAQAL